MISSQVMMALGYVYNSGGGATLAHFIDDHAPIGGQLWKELERGGLAEVSEGRVVLTVAGREAFDGNVNDEARREELVHHRASLEDEQRAIKAAIRREVEKYEADVTAAWAEKIRATAKALQSVNVALEELRRRREAATVAHVEATDPRVGKRYRQWKPKEQFSLRPGNYAPVDVYGVGVVLTEAMRRACKQRGLRCPCVGDVVIRQLKRDGTPSAYYWHTDNVNTWRPVEGHDDKTV